MKRSATLCLLVALLALTGCKNRRIAGDPFGSPVIQPPGTTINPGGFNSGADPYYPSGGPAPHQGAPLQPTPNNSAPPANQNVPPLYQGSGVNFRSPSSKTASTSAASPSKSTPREPRLLEVPNFDTPVLNSAKASRRGTPTLVDDSQSGTPTHAASFRSDNEGKSVIRISEPTARVQPKSDGMVSVLKTSNSSNSKPRTVELASATSASKPSIDLADLPRLKKSTSPAGVTFRQAVPRSSAGYGHDKEYAWLKGKLEYSASRNQWKLRYIPIDGVMDDFGGSAVLSSVDTSRYSAGDSVQVFGSLGKQESEEVGFSAVYRVTRIQANGER